MPYLGSTMFFGPFSTSAPLLDLTAAALSYYSALGLAVYSLASTREDLFA
jgi:hypothetical protein